MKATGGLAAGTALSPAMLRAATSQIKHIVVAMMENRSFDHFLGWLPNANGKQAGLSYVDVNGVSHPTHELAPEWTGCGYNDPDHSYDGGRIEVDNGLMDGFMKTSTADVFAIGYYREADNQFFPKFARNFTACDMYFPSILGPTFPNRIFQLCGQTDRLDDSVSLCSYPTIFDHCSAAGVSSKYYFGNVPFLTLFPIDAIKYANSFSDFLSDCANGTLPAVSFVDPSFTLVLNTANDNHPQVRYSQRRRVHRAGVPGGYRPARSGKAPCWCSTTMNGAVSSSMFRRRARWRLTTPIRTWSTARLCWVAACHASWLRLGPWARRRTRRSITRSSIIPRC